MVTMNNEVALSVIFLVVNEALLHVYVKQNQYTILKVSRVIKMKCCYQGSEL